MGILNGGPHGDHIHTGITGPDKTAFQSGMGRFDNRLFSVLLPVDTAADFQQWRIVPGRPGKIFIIKRDDPSRQFRGRLDRIGHGIKAAHDGTPLVCQKLDPVIMLSNNRKIGGCLNKAFQNGRHIPDTMRKRSHQPDDPYGIFRRKSGLYRIIGDNFRRYLQVRFRDLIFLFNYSRHLIN